MTDSHPRPAAPRPRGARRATAAALLAALVAGALALAGCGSSGSSTRSSAVASASGASGTSTAARPASGDHRAAAAPREHGSHSNGGHAGAAPRISHGNRPQRPAPGTGGASVNDDHPAGRASAADTGRLGLADPCVVSRRSAERFTQTRVAAPKVAPLGPTCVYTAAGGRTVTVAVEQTVFAKLRPHLHKLTRGQIAGRPVYCGIYGQPVTYALLGHERVVVVTAPCDVGRRFAAAALAVLDRRTGPQGTD